MLKNRNISMMHMITFPTEQDALFVIRRLEGEMKGVRLLGTSILVETDNWNSFLCEVEPNPLIFSLLGHTARPALSAFHSCSQLQKDIFTMTLQDLIQKGKKEEEDGSLSYFWNGRTVHVRKMPLAGSAAIRINPV